MNPLDEQLNRLMKSAQQSQAPAGEAPRFALETRVMGAWRASPQWESGDFWVAWFQRAAIGACVLALVSLAWSRHQLAFGVGDELSMADAAMRTGVNHD